MRLIDADVLFDELVKKRYSAQSMGILHTEYPNMMAIVSKQPTVDAVEVVHGEWIEYQIPNIICCSICDCGLGVDKKHFKYCPNCGAKMDGGKQNDM